MVIIALFKNLEQGEAEIQPCLQESTRLFIPFKWEDTVHDVNDDYRID